MKKIVYINILLIIPIMFPILLSQAKDIKSKQEARALFLNAVSTLAKIGGIGAFEAPQGQAPFPRYRPTNNLTPDQSQQMLDETIRKLIKAFRLDPSLKESHHFLGVAYILANQSNNAIEALTKAIDVIPQKESSYVYLCSVLWSNERFDKAHKVANKFLEKYPDKRLKGLTLIGTTYYHQADYQNAIKTGKKIISIDDQNTAGHLLIANSYYMLGNKDIAENEFRKIIELNPQMAKEVERIKKIWDFIRRNRKRIERIGTS